MQGPFCACFYTSICLEFCYSVDYIFYEMVDKSTVSNDLPRERIVDSFGGKIEFDRPMAPLTSYQTGGPARYFLAAHSADEIVEAIAAARNLGLDYFLVGGGSNLLVSDKGFDGLIIKVDVRGLKLLEDTTIDCGAGEDLMSLVNFATQSGLTGAEFAAGIWGSVGGAIYGNAGAFGGEIGSICREITLVSRDGTIKVVEPSYCRFGYRDSYLKVTHEIVVRVLISLDKGDHDAIRDRVEEILALRENKHPNKGKSAGCFFKNIPDASQPYGKLPAGKLLEEAGAKELSCGGAKVFEKHANIIVNTGTATSEDIRRLADMMKERVRQKFNIELEEEVIQLGEF